MTEKLRFGILGCGVIGPVHAEAIAAVPDAELVAVADEDAERAQKLAALCGVRAHTDLGAMLERERLDVVNICTPSGMHGRHAIQAMRSGRHVIVEKPIEIRLEAIDEMLKVQQAAGVRLAVISQHRFDPASQEVRRLVDAGALGRLVLGNVNLFWWRGQAYYDVAWRGTWSLDGGGVLMNQTIHSIDLLVWLLGPVHSARAYTDTLVHRMETEDVAAAALRFESGALGTIAATTGAYPGVATRIELFGDQGTAMIENDELAYVHLARDDVEDVGAYGTVRDRQVTESAWLGAARDPGGVLLATHTAQIADMVRAIREDGRPLVDGVAARHPVAVIRAIYDAAATGREVLVP